jgi:hypothetical protein
MTLLGAINNRDWEASFLAWAKSPSQSEQDRCDRALNAVKKAIAASSALASMGVDVFAQGSYRNRTNVRQDSDVDVCVHYDGVYFPDYPQGMSRATLGHSPAQYTFAQYKDTVGVALRDYFGAAHVTRGNKAFDIHENTYRIDADAVPCFEYHKYFWTLQGHSYHKGIALKPDDGGPLVTNFPQQQYDNGVAKNDATRRRFKALTRIIKTLRNEMADGGYTAADPIASFLVESLVWNWPNANFDAPSWREMALRFLGWLYVSTDSDQGCSSWMEENNIKRLFGPHNSWTRAEVNLFASAGYFYIGG